MAFLQLLSSGVLFKERFIAQTVYSVCEDKLQNCSCKQFE